MKRFFSISLGLIFLMSGGCAWWRADPEKMQEDRLAQKKPVEMDLWYPPGQEELEERRRQQKELDALAAALERLFMTYADILGDEIILENLLRNIDPQFESMEAQIMEEMAKMESQTKGMKKELKGLGESIDGLETKINQEKAVREARRFKEDDYRAAIRLFRDKKYLQSIGKFRKVLRTEYPSHLHDNILFGLASNYFKMKKFDQAVKNLEMILAKHPNGDKWLISHAMLGAVYDLQGRTSKAIYILESALKHQPNSALQGILTRLLDVAHGTRSDVSS